LGTIGNLVTAASELPAIYLFSLLLVVIVLLFAWKVFTDSKPKNDKQELLDKIQRSEKNKDRELLEKILDILKELKLVVEYNTKIIEKVLDT
jgi:hypothetical protein